MTPRRSIGSLIVENNALKADIVALRAEMIVSAGHNAFLQSELEIFSQQSNNFQDRLMEADANAASLQAGVERLTRERDEAAKKREDEISATAEFIDLMNNQIEVNTKATAAVMDALKARATTAEAEADRLTKALALAILATT